VAKHLYLRKANDDLVSHCKCDKADALITNPCQMGCPWCGCGWLFICGRCRKAFTFAEGIEVAESWKETGERTVRALFRREPEPGEVKDWIAWMKILLEGFEPGERYVYFDGHVIPTTAEGVTVEGMHSRHALDFVPQVAALTDPGVRERLLGSREYWQSNRVEE
jgi:hypothetical protein